MTAVIKIGQQLEGKIGSYLVTAQVAHNVWTASRSNPKLGKVVFKIAPRERLINERNVLKQFQGRPYIRQLLDETNEPPSMILQHLDDNLLDICAKKAIEGADLKFVAKRILQALQALHEEGFTHTDVKPDNILVNYGGGTSRFEEVALADCGDVLRIDPELYLKIGEFGPHMGAGVFRSPEAMINLRWGQSSDIWSFGATLISLIWGFNFHIFKPLETDATFDDESYLIHILIRQIAMFGPVPNSFISLIADEDTSRREALGTAIQFIEEYNRRKPFEMAKDECLTEEDKEFILKIMKFDPRDRPTAGELLKDNWLAGVP